MGGMAQPGILLDEPEGFLSGLRQNGRIPDEVGHPEIRKPGLPDAQEFSGSPQGEVFLRNILPVKEIAMFYFS